MLLPAALLFFAALGAFSLSAICGGGAGLILLPLLTFFLPASQVPAALSLGTMASSLSRIVVFWRKIRWHIVLWFVPAALPAVWLGALLLSRINPLYFEFFMGLFLLTNLRTLFRSDGELRAPHPLPNVVLMLIGAAAGFLSGLTGAVGLLFNRFYLRYGLSKEEMVATRAANEVLLHLVKLVLYLQFGLLTHRALLFGLLIAVAACLSAGVMRWLLPRIRDGLFRRIGYFAMVASGVVLFSNASGQIVTQQHMALDYEPIKDGLEAKLRWRESLFAMEFEYNEGFEFERGITLDEMPVALQTKVKALAKGADKVLLEEVFTADSHSYEAYIYRNGKLEKHYLKDPDDKDE